MLEAIGSGQIEFSAQSGFHLKQGAEVVEEIDACLKKMRWGWLISRNGEFIGSDSPVALDGPRDEPLGFKNAVIVTYPVSRHVLLYGTQEPVPAPTVTTKLISRHNTFAMLSGDEQVYSDRPDFHWLDKTGKCQNDWQLFSKDDLN